METSRPRKLTSEQRIVLSRITGLVEYWQITAEELEGPAPPKPKPPPSDPLRVKYRHPKTGETWDGEGRQPDWLRLALSKEGYRVSELVPSEPSAEPSAGMDEGTAADDGTA